MTKTVVHMIGQAHLDPAWLWRWREGRAEALATSQSAVDRLREYPDFHFVRGEAQVYQWIEEENPELFVEILRLIEEGRWHVVNGMIIQPDVNLPGGEALVRQVSLGKAYMRERLGVEPRVGYCVDSFGHPGTLPQILKKCGFDSYVFMRPGPHEKELPAEVFWWQAPDGSRVLAYRIPEAYTSRDEDQAARIGAAVRAKPPQLSHTMCFFGVGDHGGGPTRRQIENVLAMARSGDGLEIRFSSPDAYFAAIASEAAGLPAVVDELHFHAVGCYSVNSALKRTYRQAECALLTAERMAALAQAWLATPAPTERLDDLWHSLCFNQFHDVLGGSCIKEAQDEAVMALGCALLGARMITDDATRAIAAQVDTSVRSARLSAPEKRGGAVVLFNPHAEPVSQYVEYEPWTDWQPWRAEGWGLLEVEDPARRGKGADGGPVPYQLIESHDALTSASSGLNRIVFRARVPAMGYRVYRFAPGVERAQLTDGARASGGALENGHLFVRLDPATGCIVSCIDKASERELVGAGGWNVAQVLEDTSDTWSHGIRRYATQIGAFGEARISVHEQGPVQASLLVERSYEGNTWLQQVILRQDEREVLIRNWLAWRGRWRVIKLAFDVATAHPQSAHDVPFGWQQRPCDGTEAPTQMWMDVTGPALEAPPVGHEVGVPYVGLALINDGKYGCDVTGSTMRLTVLRCPPYAYDLAHRIGDKQRYDWVDQGEQRFDLLLRPHVGDWRACHVVKRAREFNLPFIAITTDSHPGSRPPWDSLLQVDSEEIEITAVKPAMDGDGYIVRLADCHGRGGAYELRWGDEFFGASLSPFEVATFRLAQREERWKMIGCDMLERSQEEE